MPSLPPDLPPADLHLIEATTPAEQALAEMQKALEAEKDARREERFFWLMLVLIVADMYAFTHMANWSGPIIIGLLEFVLVIAVARSWGMDVIYTLTEKIINKWNGAVGK